LYGEKGGLNQKTLDNFRTTGIVHIVVLSGANVTLIAVFLLNIFSRISRRFGFIIGSVGILAFAIMTGGGTTTLRASIMALLAVGTQWFGREYDITRALAIAGFIMIAFNPLTLLYDISFQLSFLATIGLVYIGPLIEPFIRWMPKQFELRSNFLATIATQIFVLPLLMYSTGQVSIISIIVNLLALPFIPYAMLFGFLSSLAGFLFAPLAWILSLPTYFFLTVPLRLVDLFSRISWASVTLPQIPMWSLILCYLILFCIAVKQGKKMSSQFL
jgi:competence protein ComEC